VTFWAVIQEKSPLLILIRSDRNQVFGAYTSAPFPKITSESSASGEDENCFLFSLSNKSKIGFKIDGKYAL
jgi:hypothetical protein